MSADDGCSVKTGKVRGRGLIFNGRHCLCFSQKGKNDSQRGKLDYVW